MLGGTLLHTGSPDPSLTTVAPNVAFSSFAPTSSRPTVGLCRCHLRLVDAARAIRAHTIHAILFASSTRTSIGGLRDNIPLSHLPDWAAASTCCLMISRRLSDPSPKLCVVGHFSIQCHEMAVIAPSRCLPSVKCCRGVSPSGTPQACFQPDAEKIPGLADSFRRQRKGCDGRADRAPSSDAAPLRSPWHDRRSQCPAFRSKAPAGPAQGPVP